MLFSIKLCPRAPPPVVMKCMYHHNPGLASSLKNRKGQEWKKIVYMHQVNVMVAN